MAQTSKGKILTFTQSYDHLNNKNLSHSPTPPPTDRKHTHSPSKNRKKPSNKIDNILQNLYQKHQAMKNHIQMLRAKQQQQQQQQLQRLTFSPKITHSHRYKVNSTFQQRQQTSIKERKSFIENSKKQTQQTMLKQCHFKPNIISKKQSQQILKKKQNRLNQTINKQHHSRSTNKIVNTKTNSPFTTSKKSNSQHKSINNMKHLIKFELNRLDLP